MTVIFRWCLLLALGLVRIGAIMLGKLKKKKTLVISFSVTPSDANFRKNLTRHKSSTKEIATLLSRR